VPERDAFKALLGLGLTDAFRLFEQDERSFSWWDYRMMAFRRNFGLRIDHLLLSAAAGRKVQRLLRRQDPAQARTPLRPRPGGRRDRHEP
jgi:exodeoxyribonuclease-3